MGSVQGFQERSQKVEEPTVAAPQTNGLAKAAKATTAAVAASEEVVLLAWLIVLLRTREDQQFAFEWAYRTGTGAEQTGWGPVMRVLASEVVPELSIRLNQAASAIASRIAACSPKTSPPVDGAGPVSLLLSTGALSSRGSSKGDGEEGKKDEPTLHLEVLLDSSSDSSPVEVRPAWHSEDMLPFTVRRHVENLKETVSQCLSRPEAAVQSLLGPTEHDLEQIWRWNGELPPTHDCCMHDVVAERARRHPHKEAIASFDGRLTYGEVDGYSTVLARRLRADWGVRLGDVVPLCFEKSRWTIVGVLAVLKAGATMVMMDPSLPLGRLRNMAGQVGARIIVSSRKQRGLAEIMMLTLANGGCLCIPSDEERLNDINGAMRRMGVNYAGITPSVARILDLDVIRSLRGGLGLGGEAVSAGDVDVWGRHARIIIGYGPCECTIGCTINPSAATGRGYISIGPGNGAAIWIVDPADHEVLMPVGAVGELLVEGPIVGQGYLDDPEKTAAAFIGAPRWLEAGYDKGRYQGRSGQDVRLYKTGDLGRYDPDGSGGIVFVGRKDTQVKLRGQRVELGEIESQLRTRLPAEATVIAEVITPAQAPSSQAVLVAFVAPRPANAHGQEVALETVRLDADLCAALARADHELAEVLPRYMVPTAYIPVNRIPTLISGKTDRKKLRQFGTGVDLRQMTVEAVAAVAEGSTDHKNGLNGSSGAVNGGHDHGSAVNGDNGDHQYHQQEQQQQHRRPLSETEERLRGAWARTLRLDPDTIGAADNFFALGGDSLAAMRLVSVCREAGLDLSVVKTFSNPTLSSMATVATPLDLSSSSSSSSAGTGSGENRNGEERGSSRREPFSLMPQPLEESLVKEAARACGVEVAEVQDMYPCTPTQESLFTFSLKSAEPYVAQRVATIPAHISLEAWKQAWEAMVASTPVLRSRLVQIPDRSGLDQVVLTEGIQWRYVTVSDSLDRYLEQDRKERMDLGQSLARYAIVEVEGSAGGGGQEQKEKQRYMVWTLHHAVYDGWSEPLLLEQVRGHLKKNDVNNNEVNGREETETSSPSTPTRTMADFVQFLLETDEAETQAFWRRELQGATGPQFPRVPSRDFVPTADRIVERQVSLPPGA
ncbi:hypothetical protein VTH82DRAFT_4012 [Thermothelomyces myriococcoides]